MLAYKNFIFKVVSIINPKVEMGPTAVFIESMFQIERKFSMVGRCFIFSANQYDICYLCALVTDKLTEDASG